MAGYAHGIHDAVMADLGQTIAGIGLDQSVEGLGGVMAGILIIAQIRVSIERLGIFIVPGGDLVFVHVELAALHPGGELMQRFFIVVFRNAGVVAVIPIMHAANQIVAFYMAV